MQNENEGMKLTTEFENGLGSRVGAASSHSTILGNVGNDEDEETRTRRIEDDYWSIH